MATPSTNGNKELIRDYFEALNEQDWGAYADLIAEEVVYHQAGESIHGRDGLIEHDKGLYETFPDATLTVEEVLAEDDMVAARTTTTGTHEGEVAGIEPTGETVELSANLIGRLENDQLAELWAEADQLDLMQQLGAIEPPGE